MRPGLQGLCPPGLFSGLHVAAFPGEGQWEGDREREVKMMPKPEPHPNVCNQKNVFDGRGGGGSGSHADSCTRTDRSFAFSLVGRREESFQTSARPTEHKPGPARTTTVHRLTGGCYCLPLWKRRPGREVRGTGRGPPCACGAELGLVTPDPCTCFTPLLHSPSRVTWFSVIICPFIFSLS